MFSIVFGIRGGPAGAASTRVVGNTHDLTCCCGCLRPPVVLAVVFMTLAFTSHQRFEDSHSGF